VAASCPAAAVVLQLGAVQAGAAELVTCRLGRLQRFENPKICTPADVRREEQFKSTQDSQRFDLNPLNKQRSVRSVYRGPQKQPYTLARLLLRKLGYRSRFEELVPFYWLENVVTDAGSKGWSRFIG
jgi:hypothetical protein